MKDLQNALAHAENLVNQHRGPEAIVKYRSIINTLVSEKKKPRRKKKPQSGDS